MVDHLQPGQQRLIEVGQAEHLSPGHFGQEIGLDELEEAFDFAPPFGVVGRAQDAPDAQVGADGVKVLGGVDLALVDIDGQGPSVAQDGSLKAIFQAGQLFIPRKRN
jgi:hypothetical protein